MAIIKRFQSNYKTGAKRMHSRATAERGIKVNAKQMQSDSREKQSRFEETKRKRGKCIAISMEKRKRNTTHFLRVQSKYSASY
jgi:hypothetical protein